MENRSLMTHDIIGSNSRRASGSVAATQRVAGVTCGSPKNRRKNESTVFSHLTETDGREALKKKDLNIPKPAVVSNNLATHNAPKPAVIADYPTYSREAEPVAPINSIPRNDYGYPQQE